MVLLSNANEHMKKDLISVTSRCFNEPKEIVTYFFENKFKTDNCFVCLENDKPVSVVNILDQKLMLKNKLYKVGYIYGVCTLPEFRGKGYMKKLLNYAESCIASKGYDCSFLVPESRYLERFYENIGYRNFFKTKSVFLSKNEMIKLSEKESKETLNGKFLSYPMERLRCCLYNNFNGIVYEREDIDYAVNLYRKFGGNIVSIDGGYTIGVPMNDFTVELKDFTCDFRYVDKLVSEVLKKFSNYEIYLVKTNSLNICFNNCGSINFYGMIKPLNKSFSDEINNTDTEAYLGLAFD